MQWILYCWELVGLITALILPDTVYNISTLLKSSGFNHCIDFTIWSLQYINTADIHWNPTTALIVPYTVYYIHCWDLVSSICYLYMKITASTLHWFYHIQSTLYPHCWDLVGHSATALILPYTMYNISTLLRFSEFNHCIDFTICSVYHTDTAEI